MATSHVARGVITQFIGYSVTLQAIVMQESTICDHTSEVNVNRGSSVHSSYAEICKTSCKDILLFIFVEAMLL